MARKTKRSSRRARYADAIAWIIENDWLGEDEGGDIIISVTGYLVADLFGRGDKEVAADLRRAKRKRGLLD